MAFLFRRRNRTAATARTADVELNMSVHQQLEMPESIHAVAHKYCADETKPLTRRAAAAAGLLLLVALQYMAASALVLGIGRVYGPCISSSDCGVGDFCAQGFSSANREYHLNYFDSNLAKWWRHEEGLHTCLGCEWWTFLTDQCGNATFLADFSANVLAEFSVNETYPPHYLEEYCETWKAECSDSYFRPGTLNKLNLTGMRPGNWIVLFFMCIIVCASVVSEASSIDKASLRILKELKGANRMRKVLAIIQTFRRSTMAWVVVTVPLFIIGDRADITSIILNTVASLVILEADNCAFRTLLDEPVRASEIATPLSLTAGELTALRRSRWLHGTAVLLSTLGTVQLGRIDGLGTEWMCLINAGPLWLLFWTAEAQLLTNSCGCTVCCLIFVQLVSFGVIFGGLVSLNKQGII